jgi:hypothetical protein
MLNAAASNDEIELHGDAVGGEARRRESQRRRLYPNTFAAATWAALDVPKWC